MLAEREELTMVDPVSAFYHVWKHKNSQQFFTEQHGWSVPNDQFQAQYFAEMKNHIFMDEYKDRTTISQDGKMTSTIYQDRKGYFGVTKCAYNEALGRENGLPKVATHFWKRRQPAAPATAQSEHAPPPSSATQN